MHLQECEGEEKKRNTCACSLASPRRAGLGRTRCSVARRGEAKGVGAQHACERVNDPPKSVPNSCLHATSFCHLFLK
jgi:hypothetical protein